MPPMVLFDMEADTRTNYKKMVNQTKCISKSLLLVTIANGIFHR
jgi:IS1 family transposase